ncbi:MAG: hypothetical protein Q7J47_03330 [Azoarcus sp.]|nr:hypothetical protein [Azoarcus sp.]
MPKQLIIEACLVNYGDDRGGVGQSAGDIVDVPRDTARGLATAGRALYINKADDPDKSGRFTAPKDMIKAAEAMAAAHAKAAVQTSAQGEGA